jgi:diguanylate cyclase (GGDEF)-like protein/PAS domain S-box-containing protein
MPRPSYAKFKSRLILSSLLIVALLGALVSWKISAGIKADREAAFSQTQSFARAMAAHVASQIRVVDLSLLRSAEALGALDAFALKDVNRVREILGLSASVSDKGFWIHFLSAGGMGIESSNGLPIAHVSYADRLYFSVHRRNSEAGLFVGAPDMGRVSRRRVFFLSRGVFDSQGKFLGVVVASVDATAFADVFSDALLQPTLSIALMHSGGLVIARAPQFERSFASNLGSSDLYRHWKSASADSYEGRSMVDGQMRVFSYQSIGDMPLAVVVGIARKSWTRAISLDTAVALAALVMAALAFYFSGRSALRSFASLARSDDEQRRLNEELRLARDENARGEKRIRMIADSLPALVGYVDAEERYVFHNSYYRTVLGVDADRMKGRTIEEAMGKDVYECIVDQVRLALDGKAVSFERDINVGDEGRTYKFAYTPDLGDNGAVVGFCTMAIDVTETKNVQDRLHALARFDTLTGLPNRAQLYERLEMALARSRRGAPETACLYLDIDHFKSINDSLGHATGDEALREFGRRLQSAARDTDLVARLAGDEFVMVLEDMDPPGAAAAVAEAVIKGMRAPFLIFGLEMSISTSVGVAVSNSHDQSADDLLKRADAALYSAKRAGRGMFKTSERSAPGPSEV